MVMLNNQRVYIVYTDWYQYPRSLPNFCPSFLPKSWAQVGNSWKSPIFSPHSHIVGSFCPYPKWDPQNLLHTACSQTICWAFTETRSKAEAALGRPMDAQTKPGSPAIARHCDSIGWAFFHGRFGSSQAEAEMFLKKFPSVGKLGPRGSQWVTKFSIHGLRFSWRIGNYIHQFFEVGKTICALRSWINETCWRITQKRSTNGASWRFAWGNHL